MATPLNRSQLKKQFLAGELTPNKFHELLEGALKYRGYYSKPGKNPKWSGPFHWDKASAVADNAPWFNAGYDVGIYTEQA